MPIQDFSLGPLETNCYVLYDGAYALAVDPGGDPAEVMHFLKARQLTLLAILGAPPFWRFAPTIPYRRPVPCCTSRNVTVTGYRVYLTRNMRSFKVFGILNTTWLWRYSPHYCPGKTAA